MSNACACLLSSRTMRQADCYSTFDRQGLRNSSGSLAIFAAIRRASFLLSNLAADRRPGSSSK